MIKRKRGGRATSARLAAGMLFIALAAMALAAPRAGAPVNYAQRPEVREFIAELVAAEGFDAHALGRLFAQARHQPKVVAAMSRPVLSPPKWYEFAPRFLDPARVDAGVAFWREHSAVLSRARDEFGVPPEVIVAIIGVETYYGRNTGSYRVFDALTTLAFDYPRRAEFFRGELKQFLLLTREQGASPLAIKGSYAGAMGLPQFMPGSIRAYALDYDADGHVDLAAGSEDAIGSVAHFLVRHGWQAGQPTMTPVRIEAENPDAIVAKLEGGIAERRSLAAWARDGMTGFGFPGDLAPDPVGLLMLEEETGPTYWLVFNNWYVLTRYNRSRLYASAVWKLAQALKLAAEGGP
ncbi:MAG: lytic murein transglycosylase B [Pseudomonadota bacterium]|nr:lytic murein transglycosylase B [Pseudomonadota bacterium]